MKKINVLYYKMLQFQDDNLQLLKKKFNLIELNTPADDTDDILKTINVVFAPLGYYFGKEKINKSPELKVIASNTTGHPHIDVEYASKKGIDVATLKHEQEFLDTITPTAELAWGLITAVTRNIVPANKYVMSGMWNRRPFGGTKMLSNMKIGVVGLGRLGKRISQYAKGFDMEVFYYDPYVDSSLLGVEKVLSLEELVSIVDIVTVHVPHEKITENMFDQDIFDKFMDGSFFINTSRGELVDHNALLNALKSGKISGAGLDVFEGEFSSDFELKMKSHPLWLYAQSNNNLVITPHIGGSTIDAWYETERHTIDMIINYIETD